MAQFKAGIIITSDNADDAQKCAQLVQHAVATVDLKDMIKLLSKVKENPKIVKTALKFI